MSPQKGLHFVGHQSEGVDTGLGGRRSRPPPAEIHDHARTQEPSLDLTPVPEGTPLTFDTMAQAYLEDYVLQRYRTMNTARPRVEHLREFLGGWAVEAITADAVRRYQLHRRKQGAEAATINRETSALSRMFQLAIRRGLLERMPLFPNRVGRESAARGVLRT